MKFRDRGGFFAEVDESILCTADRWIITRGAEFQARTLIDDLPTKIPVADIVNPLKSRKLKDGEYYFNLQEHIDMINSKGNEIADEYEL